MFDRLLANNLPAATQSEHLDWRLASEALAPWRMHPMFDLRLSSEMPPSRRTNAMREWPLPSDPPAAMEDERHA